jgi:hypothetical protein
MKMRNLGGFDVLITPFEPEEVLRAPSSPGAEGNAILLRAPLEKRSLQTVAGRPRLALTRKLAVR